MQACKILSAESEEKLTTHTCYSFKAQVYFNMINNCYEGFTYNFNLNELQNLRFSHPVSSDSI